MTKIKMKTRNLTQSRARNDPINRRIHDFSFRNFEDEDDIQDVISPYSLDQFLISNTPRTQKRVKKGKKSKDSWTVVSRQFDFTWKSKGSVFVPKNIEFIEKFGVTVGSNGLIAINDRDDAPVDESMRLSCIRPIGDGASTVSHIARLMRRVVWFVR